MRPPQKAVEPHWELTLGRAASGLAQRASVIWWWAGGYPTVWVCVHQSKENQNQPRGRPCPLPRSGSQGGGYKGAIIALTG